MAGRRPDFVVKVKVRFGAGGPGTPDGATNTVGVAWLNSDGSVSISLRPGVTLSWDDGLQITAFPNDREVE